MGVTPKAIDNQLRRQGLYGGGYVRPRGPRVRDERRAVRPSIAVPRKDAPREMDEDRPTLPKMAGWVRCLKCRTKFLSPHRVNIRRCSRCKKGERENPFESDYQVALTGAEDV